MGVPGLWQILLPAAQMRSLTQVATVEGFERDHHGLRTIILGIDASIWMKKSQAKFYHPQHAQAGENPELRVLFYRLCYLLRHPITPIFIFDGPAWPAIKHNTNVIAQAHWLTQWFQEFISVFGFHSHMVPGEAEAKLVYLNWANMIDAVMTDDGDALIFGATCIIRDLNIKKDGDAVTIFTKTAVQTTQDVRLTEGGMLLIALLSGGDYDMIGLPRCGETIAYKLSCTGLGDSLLDAAQQLSSLELSMFLALWHEQLWDELSTDKSGFLGHHLSGVACSVHDNFPSTDVIRLYARPATLWCNGGNGPDTSVWLPQMPLVSKLAALCEHSFSWNSQAVASCFQNNVWEGCCIRRLAQITKAFTVTSLQQHVNNGIVNDPPPALSSFLQIQKVKLGPASLKVYRVETPLCSLVVATCSGLAQWPSHLPTAKFNAHKMLVSIPAQILECALPSLVQQFKAQDLCIGAQPEPICLLVF